MVEMLGEGIINDTDERDAVVYECERDADIGVAVHKIGGAVDGIADEGWSSGQRRVGVVGFLAVESSGVLVSG